MLEAEGGAGKGNTQEESSHIHFSENRQQVRERVARAEQVAVEADALGSSPSSVTDNGMALENAFQSFTLGFGFSI